MECPHCGTDNLLGALTCMNCRKGMLDDVLAPVEAHADVRDASDDPPGPRDAARKPVASMDPPPWAHDPADDRGLDDDRGFDTAVAADAGPREVMCRICLGPFLRAADDTVNMCPHCRGIDVGGADLGRNDVILPGSQYDAPPGQDFQSRMSGGELKPRIYGERKARLRTGPVVFVVVLAIAGLAWAAYALWPRSSRTDEYIRDVKRVPHEFVVAPEAEKLVRLETTFNLWITHETLRATFKGQLDALIDVYQKSILETEMVLAGERGGSPMMDLTVETLIADQKGRYDTKDASELKIHPWPGHNASARVVLSSTKPPVSPSGAELLIGRDVPPFVSLGSLEPPAGRLEPGRRWITEVPLPLMCDRDGRLMIADFSCTFTYEGTRLLGGYDCVTVRLSGRPPKSPPKKLDGMNRTGGAIRGALFFDVRTGLLCEAHIDVDAHSDRDSGRLDERCRVQGQVEIRRK